MLTCYGALTDVKMRPSFVVEVWCSPQAADHERSYSKFLSIIALERVPRYDLVLLGSGVSARSTSS